MKRFHLHVSVEDLDRSIRFYSTLFAAEPAVRQCDYAKWMIEDPRLNFAISTRHQLAGVNHLGFQVDTDEELRGLHAQLQAADARLIQEDDQPCCYAQSDKYWVTDPTGIAWETFHTLGSIPVYGEDTPVFNHGESVVLGHRIRSGQSTDLSAISQLLKGAGLPTADLVSAHEFQTWVMEKEGLLVGVIGLERFGSEALLRSLAVAPEHRTRGLGTELVARVEHHARAAGIQQLILLTETAEPFFRCLGYVVTDRSHVSEKAMQSAEFHSLCPVSAVCMRKALTTQGSNRAGSST